MASMALTTAPQTPCAVHYAHQPGAEWDDDVAHPQPPRLERRPISSTKCAQLAYGSKEPFHTLAAQRHMRPRKRAPAALTARRLHTQHKQAQPRA